jgi:hypothetical protein
MHDFPKKLIYWQAGKEAGLFGGEVSLPQNEVSTAVFSKNPSQFFFGL